MSVVCGAGCGEAQFRCTDGRCIGYELQCNGVEECSDGSDERDCGNYAIHTTYSCPYTRVYIHIHAHIYTDEHTHTYIQQYTLLWIFKRRVCLLVALCPIQHLGSRAAIRP